MRYGRRQGQTALGADEGYNTISRYEMAEVCLDADRWRDYDKGGMAVILDKLDDMGWGTMEWKAEIEKALPEAYWGV